MSTFPNHWHAKQPFLLDEDLLSISPVFCGQLMNLLITLEPHGIFRSTYILVDLNIAQPLIHVCKTVTRLLREFKTSKYAEHRIIYFKIEKYANRNHQ